LGVRLTVSIMSGVEDGLQLNYSTENGDGQITDDKWVISIGRREDSDICLRNDTFVSRWLEDLGSTNGTYLEHEETEARVKGTIPIDPGFLFRIGHTWMRIEPDE
jgi:pSer/pThr/pTyr-binding forkhead associated (FHA) protein